MLWPSSPRFSHGLTKSLLNILVSFASWNKHFWRNTHFTRFESGVSVCAGLVEIEEGELTAQQLNLQSQTLARISFAREPHVQQVSYWLFIYTSIFFFFFLLFLCQWPWFCFPSFRFAECFSFDQMGNLNRQFPWQQTTRHWCSTCTSPTVDHLDSTGWPVSWSY